jgi:hypothetical protein
LLICKTKLETKNKKNMALAITDATDEVVLKSDKPVVVDFLGSLVATM